MKNSKIASKCSSFFQTRLINLARSWRRKNYKKPKSEMDDFW